VLDGKLKKDIKKDIVELGTNVKLNFSNYPTRRNRGDGGIGWNERHGKNED
jgi:hypothetical protein